MVHARESWRLDVTRSHVLSPCAASGMQSASIHAVKASNVEFVSMLLEFRAEPGLLAREWHEEYGWDDGYDRHTNASRLGAMCFDHIYM